MVLKTIYSRPGRDQIMDFWAYTAHHATASIQDGMRDLHHRALDWLDKHSPQALPYLDNLHRAESIRVEVDTKAPAVRVHCVEQTVAFSSPVSQHLSIEFPRLQENRTAWVREPDQYSAPDPHSELFYGRDIFDVTDKVPQYLFKRGVTNSSNLPLNATEIFADYRRVLVIPQDIWNGTASSLGLLILLAGDNDQNKEAPFNAMACSIDARWSLATSIMTNHPDRQPLHFFYNGRTGVPARVELRSETMRRLDYHEHRFDPPRDGSLTPIRLHESWYELVSPTLPDDLMPTPDPLFRGGRGQSSFERILEIMYYSDAIELGGDQRRAYQNMLSVMVADAVARAGSSFNNITSRIIGDLTPVSGHHEFNESLATTMIRHGDPTETFSRPSIFEGHNTTKITMKAVFTGYVLSSSTSWFNWFCIGLLLAHAAMALIHSIWVVLLGTRTSNAWDTIPQLVALAQQSEPPAEPILMNTSAGSRSFQTPGLLSWVEVADNKLTDAQRRGQGPLRLIVNYGAQSRESGLMPKVDTRYN